MVAALMLPVQYTLALPTQFLPGKQLYQRIADLLPAGRLVMLRHYTSAWQLSPTCRPG